MLSRFLGALLTVALAASAFGQAAFAPVITRQPEGISVFVGDTAVLSAAVDGNPAPTIQWFRNSVLVPSAGTATFTLANAALADFATYHFTATNSEGSVTSVPVAIHVAKRPQTITFNVSATQAAAGSSVTVTATASSGLPVTLTLVSGSASLSGGLLTGAGGNVVVRAAQAGNGNFEAATSVERTVAFVAGSLSPFFPAPLADRTVLAGAAVALRAPAVGTPVPTYQWFKDGVAVPGAVADSLAFAAVAVTDAGRYSVVATNLAGTATSAANLVVRAPPVFTVQPAAQEVTAGTAVTFTAAVTGSPAPTLQWRKNGTALPGATGATFTLPAAAAADAGRYDIVATNVVASVTSAPAVLGVSPHRFAGLWFGRIAGSGDAVLFVRADGTAVFLALLPGGTTGLAATHLRVSVAGTFSAATTTLAATPGTAVVGGNLDAIAGTFSGTVAELGVTFDGTRAPAAGPAAAIAGFYHAALIGSAAGRGYVVLGADGQAFLLTANGTAPDGARGSFGPNGRVALTTTGGAAVDLGFNNGSLAGTVRAGTVTGAIGGALDSLVGNERLANLSIRSTTQNASPLITGFVVSGPSSATKRLLVRAAGPALAAAPFNVAGTLADPSLQLRRGATAVAQNNNWGTPAAGVAALTAAANAVGAFPFRAGSTDAALVATLAPAAYTATISGGNGVVLAEVYEVSVADEIPGARRLVNISARGLVTPANPLIAGFVIAGTAPQRVLVRGIGPTIGGAPFNVAGVLPNPRLAVFRGTTAVKANDDWFRDADAALVRTTAAQVGAFALGAQSLDAATLLFLEPGAYTVQITGPANANAANGTGIALIEIYEAAP